MAEGYDVEAGELRAHAAHVAAVQARFAAVRSASAAIAADDTAYGLLCGWISGVLEGKHARQDELLAEVAENLELVDAALRASAEEYEAIEQANAEMITASGGER